MTIPEMKLEVMTALDPAYAQGQQEEASTEKMLPEPETAEDFYKALKRAGG